MTNFKYLFNFINTLLLFKSCLHHIIRDTPNDLSKINKIYKTSSKIPKDEQPIIAYSKVFFLSDDATRVLDCVSKRIFTLSRNLNRYPILYTNTIFSFESLFVTKDKYIYLYKERGINTYENSNLLWYKEFAELGPCYNTMRIFYDHKTTYAAIYNYYNSNKIIVIKLENEKKKKNSDIIEIEKNRYLVSQALIYSSDKEEEKSLLIVIDNNGIRFYNIIGYKNKYIFWNDKGAEIKGLDGIYGGKADFIDGNKLLFVYNEYLIIFELEDINIPFKKYKFLNGDSAECVLGLKNGNALVGTNNGYIYLFGYAHGEIKYLDKRQICRNAVYSLSYTNNCYEYSKSCFVFAANCGYIYVFEIGN